MSVAQLPKYQNIKQAVLADIRNGKLRPGDKLPVRTELLEIYNTTRVTLDKALSELVDEKILTASRRAGTFVASQQSLQKIAIITGVTDPIQGQLLQRYNYQDMYASLQELLKERTVQMIKPEYALAAPEMLREFDYVIVNPLSEKDLNKLSQCLGGRERIILLNRPFEGYHYASTDHRGAAKALTSLFLKNLPPESELIYLDVRFAEPYYVESVPELRKKGFIDACAEYRRFYRLVNVGLKKHLEYLEYNVADISELQSQTLGGKVPSCIISPSKCFTGAILRHLSECGLKLNRDVYYADFDNYNSQMDTGYAITSVLEDFTGIAEATASMVNENKLQSQLVPYHIVNNPFNTKI